MLAQAASNADRTSTVQVFSTAFITGLLIIAMLLTRPESLVTGRITIVGAALGLYLVTMPLRKAIAIAINYLHNPDETR